MSKTAINDLQVLIRKLQAERQGHVEAITEIDKAFSSLGIKPQKQRRRPASTRAASKKRVAKKRTGKKAPKKFKMTAHELVVATIRKAGAKGTTGAEINKAWRAAGRPGEAYNTLGELTRAKRIKRRPLKGKPGSLYTVG